MIKTCELKAGDSVRLIGYGHTDMLYRRRLLSFGMTPGVDVRIVRRAPLGCPIQLLVRGVSLMLRETEAACLHWEYV